MKVISFSRGVEDVGRVRVNPFTKRGFPPLFCEEKLIFVERRLRGGEVIVDDADDFNVGDGFCCGDGDDEC